MASKNKKQNEVDSVDADLGSESFDFPKEEEKVLKMWKEIDAFRTQLKLSENRKRFTFYDGPPFATGLPHYGHILAGTIKDTVTRWATQTGHHVERRFGWDCHGLPVEFEIDKKLGIKGPSDVLKMGVDNYNNECRSIVMRYSKEWEEIISRLGRWIDFQNDYKTLYPTFMESVWWVFKEIYKKKLVYRGFKVMPYSTSCCTPLSNFEAGQNYKDVQDPAVVITFPAIDDKGIDLGYSFLAWTTTPWTLPSNLALCMHPELDYVKIKDKKQEENQVYVLAEARLGEVFKSDQDYEILDKQKGSFFKGQKYRPLFSYFVDAVDEKAFQVLNDSYVTSDSGTGIVHQAPYFGEDDYRVCLEAKIITKVGPIMCPVDASGCFTGEVTDFAGQHVKDADKHIMKHLKEKNRLYSQATIQHQYPFCWRSDTPLLYKAVPSWFIKVEEIKDKLLENNAKTYWVPDFAKEKRFANWLSDARDWAISRNRFWGNPIPLWVSDDFEEVVCVGSIEELKELSGVQDITDIHKEFVDKITIPSKMGKGVLKRVPEVFDCWFESGSMPYAQVHYPFERKEEFENNFPADFIAEGIDQTRGWFYTLLVISTAIFDKPPFKNLITNGLVLAEDGQKMSKSRKNFPDPWETINKYGADSIRLYLISSPAVRGDAVKFVEKGVRDVIKDAFLPWVNASKFLIQNVERWEAEQNKKFFYEEISVYTGVNIMDKWLLSSIQSLLKFVRQEMNAYRLYTVLPRLVKFIDTLCNWYVRLNRKRLRGETGPEDSFFALNTLYNVLYWMIRLCAPFIPFLAESIYQRIKKYLGENAQKLEFASVHYLSIPEVNENLINSDTENLFEVMQRIIVLGRTLRDRKKLALRLPVKELVVIVENYAGIDSAIKNVESYIYEELNVKKFQLSLDKERYGIEMKAKPNFAVLATKVKDKMKKLSGLIEKMTDSEVQEFRKNGKFVLDGIELNLEDIVILPKLDTAKFSQYEPGFDKNVIELLDISPDEEMVNEGVLRDVVNRVQRLRKEYKLVPTDDIIIYYQVKPENCKLDNLFRNSIEYLESNLKKPVKTFESGSNLKIQGKSFDFLDGKVELWIEKVQSAES
ncbi:isoleucine--tRNA cytoplasmic [Brachionus plicatilis]|uniref:Isoleucine--tRNA ligase, cytoplasmic n=1 Tax=Brachionus plicatilis TaxID=10195 RepID=A0A3M7SWL9_BRAPC|nr:isoleucine--tRNA cytoplasmic [Brachionus plicatilis]